MRLAQNAFWFTLGAFFLFMLLVVIEAVKWDKLNAAAKRLQDQLNQNQPPQPVDSSPTGRSMASGSGHKLRSCASALGWTPSGGSITNGSQTCTCYDGAWSCSSTALQGNAGLIPG